MDDNDLADVATRIGNTLSELAEAAERLSDYPITDLVRSAVVHILQGEAQIATGLAELLTGLSQGGGSIA